MLDIYNENIIGPKTVPCGTPQTTEQLSQMPNEPIVYGPPSKIETTVAQHC